MVFFAKRDVRGAILGALARRNPNWVLEELILRDLGDLDAAKVRDALEALVAEKRVVVHEQQAFLTQPMAKAFMLSDTTLYPIAEYIEVGGLTARRVMPNDLVAIFPEVFNAAVEELARHTEKAEERLRDRIVEEQRSFWTTIVSLFSVFAGVIALIVRSLTPTSAPPQAVPGAIFLHRLADLAPLAIVLALFVFVLRWVVPRKR